MNNLLVPNEPHEAPDGAVSFNKFCGEPRNPAHSVCCAVRGVQRQCGYRLGAVIQTVLDGCVNVKAARLTLRVVRRGLTARRLHTSNSFWSIDNVVNNRNSGRLLHGNPSGDPSTAPRCGAKTRKGTACNAPAMRSAKTGKYTRCRMHGGASTGPRTAEGPEHCRQARWKDGQRSAAAAAERKQRAAEDCNA
jgi:hypothetical protein